MIIYQFLVCFCNCFICDVKIYKGKFRTIFIIGAFGCEASPLVIPRGEQPLARSEHRRKYHIILESTTNIKVYQKIKLPYRNVGVL